MSDELRDFDAVALAALIANNDVSALEVLEATIERATELNPALNAITHTTYDKARASLDGLPCGPFRGVPMFIKDLWPGEAGEPHYRGVRGLQAADNRAPGDSHIVTEYRNAGFVLCGRTNTPEMGLGATTEPLSTGACHNPWNQDHGTGGSSGGAAAAVAAGILPAANASDGGGSIRIPAAMCGLVGLKPSRGRVSMGPYSDEWGQSVQHVVSRTMRDTAAILDATSGHYPGDGVLAPTPTRPYGELSDTSLPRLRIGLLNRPIRDGLTIDPEVAAATDAAATLLASLGHEVELSSPAALDDQELIRSFGPALAAGAAAGVDEVAATLGRPINDDDIEPWTRFIADRGREVRGPAVITAQKQIMTFRRRMASWWAEGFDLLLTPTCLRPAPKLGEMAPDNPDQLAVQTTTLHYSSLTQPFNFTGQPALSLPLAMSGSGLPIGAQFVAAYGREDQLVALGFELEQAAPWIDRRPPLFATR